MGSNAHPVDPAVVTNILDPPLQEWLFSERGPKHTQFWRNGHMYIVRRDVL